MLRVEAEIQIGALQASTTPRRESRKLLALHSELALSGSGGQCVLELAEPSLPPPSVGDAVQVSLGRGQGSTRVFTGAVADVTRTATALRITCADGLAKLARLDVEAAYEEMSAGAIVRDVLGQAGAEVGTVSDGPTLTSYLLHRGPRALRHLQRLAELCGAELFTDREGKVCFVSASEPGSAHTFRYGEHILELSLEDTEPTFDSVSVWGEGAASTQGAGKEHWLAKDLTSMNAKASLGPKGSVLPGKEGARPLCVVDGALRSSQAIRQVAQGRVAALASRSARGFLRVLGDPAVGPGDQVVLQGLPSDRPALPASPLRVRRVRHHLDARQGFVTRMDF
jgi:Phage tail baseplate hub (GPD)